MSQRNLIAQLDPAIEEYCENYRSLFSRERDFDAFRALHAAMLADIGHKSLKAIARAAKFTSYGSLRDFFNDASWSGQTLRQRRLELTLNKLQKQPLALVIQEVGVLKKGKSTDYVARQNMPDLGQRENGLLMLIAYAVCQDRLVPLTFEIFKPHGRLKPGDKFRTKTQMAIDMVEQLLKIENKIETVLLDNFYGEDWDQSLDALDRLYLDYIITVRRSYRDGLAREWTECEDWISVQPDPNLLEFFFIRGVPSSKRATMLYWETYKAGSNSRSRDKHWILITQVQDIDHQVAARYYQMKEQTEHLSRQTRNQLGWSDFQTTEYFKIEKWWEINMSAQFVKLALNLDF